MQHILTRRLLTATGATLALLGLESFARSEGIPRNVTELWAGFAELDRTTPLEAEVLKSWEQDEVTCRIVRFQVGVFHGAPSRVAAFYAFPTKGAKLPAFLQETILCANVTPTRPVSRVPTPSTGGIF